MRDEERRDPPEEAPYSDPGDAGEPLTEEDGTGAGTSPGTPGDLDEPGVSDNPDQEPPRREQPGL